MPRDRCVVCLVHTEAGLHARAPCVYAVANECLGRKYKGMPRVILCALESEIGVCATGLCPGFTRGGDRIPR